MILPVSWLMSLTHKVHLAWPHSASRLRIPRLMTPSCLSTLYVCSFPLWEQRLWFLSSDCLSWYTFWVGATVQHTNPSQASSSIPCGSRFLSQLLHIQSSSISNPATCPWPRNARKDVLRPWGHAPMWEIQSKNLAQWASKWKFLSLLLSINQPFK